MLYLAIVDTILNICRFCLNFFKNSTFCKLSFLILGVVVCINSYYLYEVLPYKKKSSKYSESISDQKVLKQIYNTLLECGDLSFVTWSVLEDISVKNGKYLQVKEALACDKDRARMNDGNCIVNIKANNILYLEPHFINEDALNFIQNKTVLPDGTILEELVPVWLNLIDNKTKLPSDEAQFLKIKAPSFWRILKKTKLAVGQLGFITVKDINKQGEPVIYIFTLSFLPSSERSCGLEKTGRQEGDYLLKMAKLAKRGLQ